MSNSIFTHTHEAVQWRDMIQTPEFRDGLAAVCFTFFGVHSPIALHIRERPSLVEQHGRFRPFYLHFSLGIELEKSRWN